MEKNPTLWRKIEKQSDTKSDTKEVDVITFQF